MDIPRKIDPKKRLIRRALYSAVAVGGIVVMTILLSNLEPAAPRVERATVWIDTVERGQMLRQVRGPGTLVPKEILWISATTDGNVKAIILEPGQEVGPDTVILELSNPELEQLTGDAELQLRAAEADYTNLEVQLESQLLDMQATYAAVEADYESAKLQVEADQELASEGLIPEIQLKRSRLTERQLTTRHEIEQQRLQKLAESVEAQLAASRARVDQLRALFRLRREQVARLRVRSDIEGVLQEVPVEVGQRVAPGANLARVAQPQTLEAELRIAQTQARDILVGQKAEVDTRNGIIPGRVSRIDPAVQEGTVTVDVELEGPLPKGARPDLSVDGTIEIERLSQVLHVGRPAYGQAHSKISLFRLDEEGDMAFRVQVQLGRTSVNTVEIVEGLDEGDRVILSDMSNWDNFDRVRLD
jgi:HlyD family secretion protein